MEIMKRLLIVVALLLTAIVSSCTKPESITKPEFGSSINDIIGTEWSIQNSDGTLGLKFYANNVVSSFLDNKYGVETINGIYEYIVTTKTLSFKGLTWYYYDSGKPAFTMNGAHIIDSHKMEIIVKTAEGEVETGYLYRK